MKGIGPRFTIRSRKRSARDNGPPTRTRPKTGCPDPVHASWQGLYVTPLWARPKGGSNTASEALTYLPMAILALVAFLLVFVTLVGNKFLGPKKGSINKLTSYECGEKATPGARGPIDVQYYMFVLTFLVFDEIGRASCRERV